MEAIVYQSSMIHMDVYSKKAAEVLAGGGIVIFPTDTAFGIGCRIDRRSAIDRVFSLRKRPITQATPVLVSSIDMALRYWEDPSEMVNRLMKTYWPGALTIVAPCDISRVYEMVRGGTETLGIRMPNHSGFLEVISSVGVPILGPSANFHGDRTPFAFDELNDELASHVDYVMPGTCTVKQPSTVVSVSGDSTIVIREGAVDVTF
jgi:L-threonylcarbamoyladenylate synthase